MEDATKNCKTVDELSGLRWWVYALFILSAAIGAGTYQTVMGIPVTLGSVVASYVLAIIFLGYFSFIVDFKKMASAHYVLCALWCGYNVQLAVDSRHMTKFDVYNNLSFITTDMAVTLCGIAVAAIWIYLIKSYTPNFIGKILYDTSGIRGNKWIPVLKQDPHIDYLFEGMMWCNITEGYIKRYSNGCVLFYDLNVDIDYEFLKQEMHSSTIWTDTKDIPVDILRIGYGYSTKYATYIYHGDGEFTYYKSILMNAIDYGRQPLRGIYDRNLFISSQQKITTINDTIKDIPPQYAIHGEMVRLVEDGKDCVVVYLSNAGFVKLTSPPDVSLTTSTGVLSEYNKISDVPAMLRIPGFMFRTRDNTKYVVLDRDIVAVLKTGAHKSFVEV